MRIIARIDEDDRSGPESTAPRPVVLLHAASVNTHTSSKILPTFAVMRRTGTPLPAILAAGRSIRSRGGCCCYCRCWNCDWYQGAIIGKRERCRWTTMRRAPVRAGCRADSTNSSTTRRTALTTITYDDVGDVDDDDERSTGSSRGRATIDDDRARRSLARTRTLPPRPSDCTSVACLCTYLTFSPPSHRRSVPLSFYQVASLSRSRPLLTTPRGHRVSHLSGKAQP